MQLFWWIKIPKHAFTKGHYWYFRANLCSIRICFPGLLSDRLFCICINQKLFEYKQGSVENRSTLKRSWVTSYARSDCLLWTLIDLNIDILLQHEDLPFSWNDFPLQMELEHKFYFINILLEISAIIPTWRIFLGRFSDFQCLHESIKNTLPVCGITFFFKFHSFLVFPGQIFPFFSSKIAFRLYIFFRSGIHFGHSFSF